MVTSGEWGRNLAAERLTGALGFTAQMASADDLTGSSRLLCVPVQTTAEQIENFKKVFSVCLEAKEFMI